MPFEAITIIFVPIIIAVAVFFIASYLSGYWQMLIRRLHRPLYVGLTYIKDGERVLLIRKEHEPYIGSWALPGGMEDRVRGDIDKVMRKTAEDFAGKFLKVKLTTRRILCDGIRLSMEASLGFRPAYIYVYETVIKEGTIKESERIKYWDIDKAMKGDDVVPIAKELLKKVSQKGA